jgi:hypothetical protein
MRGKSILRKEKAVEVLGMLIALVTFVVMFGCSHRTVGEPEARQKMVNDIRERLSGIPEPERRAQGFELLDTMEQGLAELNRTVEQYAAEAKQLNADYDATREDFNRLMVKFNTSRKSLQQQILTAHFGIKALTTPQEWAALAKIEGKAVRKILRQNLLQRYSNPSF